MANRIVDRCYIIDSASGAGTALSWPDAKLKVHTVVFYALDSTGKMELTYSEDTTSVAIVATCPTPAGDTVNIHYGEPHWFSKLNVKTLTAGTGFLYFS